MTRFRRLEVILWLNNTRKRNNNHGYWKKEYYGKYAADYFVDYFLRGKKNNCYSFMNGRLDIKGFRLYRVYPKKKKVVK